MKIYRKHILYFGIILILIFSVIVFSRWRIVSVSDGNIVKSDEIDNIHSCDNIIVLGAKVKDDGEMTPILEERMLAVLDLNERYPECKIIVSGFDQEVVPMKKFLIENDVGVDMISIDDIGADTFTSMKNSKEIITGNNVIVVTQLFHLSRSVYIGKMMNMDVVGYEAYKYQYPNKLEKYKYFAREWLTAVKAVWQSEVTMKINK